MNPVRPPWPEEAVTLLKQLWEEGRSGGQIAKAICDRLGHSFSRAAVIGKVDRLGLLVRTKGKPKKAPAPAPQKPSRIGVTLFRGSMPTRIAAPPAPPLPAVAKPKERPKETGLSSPCSILDLPPFSGHHGCRWVIGDPRTPLEPIFCGMKREQEGRPYCCVHARLAYQPARRVA